MATFENIRDDFPNLSIDSIIDQSNYESIHSMHIHLNANDESIHSHLGNGHLVLLTLAVTLAGFNTLSHTPFFSPANLISNPVYPPLTT